MKARQWLRWSLFGAGSLFLLLQAVPYGRTHTNPPVRQEPAWDSLHTRALAARACYDCHSNETKWPWYSHIAPVSWMVQKHVDKGRSELNFSDWGGPQEGEEAVEAIREGEMPLPSYLLAHPEARLSSSESQALVQGLAVTFGQTAEEEEAHEREEHHED
jgi:hypothetical protein